MMTVEVTYTAERRFSLTRDVGEYAAGEVVTAQHIEVETPRETFEAIAYRIGGKVILEPLSGEIAAQDPHLS